MPLVIIESVDDPRIAAFRHLNTSNLTRFSGMFIVEGEKLVRRLIASNYAVHSLLVERDSVERFEQAVPPSTPIYMAPPQLLKEIVGFAFHRGVLACGLRPGQPSLDALLPDPPKRATVVVCVGVQDPENLGGIIRSSAALGVDLMLIGPGCADPYSRRVLRVSMGTAFSVPLYEAADLARDLQRLRNEQQVIVVATVLDKDATPLADAPRPQRVALLFGSEGEGLPEEYFQFSEQRVMIPMQRGTDSLNVSVAAGICIYHYCGAGESGDHFLHDTSGDIS